MWLLQMGVKQCGSEVGVSEIRPDSAGVGGRRSVLQRHRGAISA